MKVSKIIIIIPIIIFLILFCLYYLYYKKIELSGIIESTQADINSEVSGKIVEVKKNEGDYLVKDEIIAVIDSSNQKKIIKQLEKNIIQKKAKLSGVKTITYTEELEQAKSNIENIRKNLDFWTDKFNRINRMYLSGKNLETEFLDVKIKLNTVKEQLALAETQYAQLKKKPRNQTKSTAKTEFEYVLAELELQKVILLKYEIKSPIDGIYLSKKINTGDIINIGSNIGIVNNFKELWVKFEIPQKYLTFINPGEGINLTLNSDKSIKINGEITNISDKADHNSLYGIKVKILDYADRLKPGMMVKLKIRKKPLAI